MLERYIEGVTPSLSSAKIDAIDIDMGYNGTLSNFYILKNSIGDECMEIDGPESASNATFTIEYGTLDTTWTQGGYSGETKIDLRNQAQGSISHIKNIQEVKLSASFQSNCSIPVDDCYDYYVSNPASLTLNSCEFDTVVVYSISGGINSQQCPLPPNYHTNVLNASNPVPLTIGFNNTGFSWTWLALNGYL